jgi:alpha-beta hydrolase superfamily lysophospholipase
MRTETTVRTYDYHELHTRYYQTAIPGVKRTLVLVHGVCEHGERYDPVARLAARRGWNVILADQRGHGLSGGVHTHVDDYDQYVNDLHCVCRHFKCIPSRTFIVGHSMGGLVSARYAQTFPDQLAGLVLVSPLLSIKVKVPWPTVALGWLLSQFTSRVRFRPRFDSNDSTRCPLSREQRMNDPLIRQSLTNGWYFATRSALKQVWRETHKIHLPVLLVQAGQDRVVDPVKAQQWLERLPSGDRSIHWLSESYHDVLSESDWLHTFAHIARWIERRDTQPSPANSGVQHLPPLTESWLRIPAA